MIYEKLESLIQEANREYNVTGSVLDINLRKPALNLVLVVFIALALLY